MTAVVEVSGLRKSYATKHGREKVVTNAVDGLDLEIATGEIFALLGPNGAARPPRWRSWKATAAGTPAS